MIKEYWQYFLGGVTLFIVVLVGSLLLIFNTVDTGDADQTNKTLINNLLIRATTMQNTDEANKYYTTLVEEGLLSEEVRLQQFDFDNPAVYTAWFRHTIEGQRDIAVLVNERITENNTGETYITVLSYRYPINRLGLTHVDGGFVQGDNLYVRTNAVFVSQFQDGQLVELMGLPEEMYITEQTSVNAKEFRLFEKTLPEAEFEEYLNQLQGLDHEHGGEE